MMQARIKSVQCLSPSGLHRMAYKEWGDPHNDQVLVCVHGLTRVSDDFDRLASVLASDYRIVCPDVVGRGRSDRLLSAQHYHVPQYMSDMVTLLARLDARTVHWVGTSMGGLVGMALASLPDSPIGKLVLNDVGPAINMEALTRIGTYVGQDLRFDTFDEGLQHIRAISAPFGPHTEDEWRKLAGDVLRRDAEGKWMKHYDLRIAAAFDAITPDVVRQAEEASWRAYDAIICPTLLLRGAQSDLLSAQTARAMTERGPRARLVEFAGVGHAPTLLSDEQIAAVRQFLLD